MFPSQGKPTDKLVRLEFKLKAPVARESTESRHGNLSGITTSGKKISIVSNNTCYQCQGDSDTTPRVLSDGLTVAYVSGEFVPSDPHRPRSSTVYAATVLVLWHKGKIIKRFKPTQKTFLEKYLFLENDTQIALRTRDNHGTATYELWDAKTGHVLKTVEESNGEEPPPKTPPWVQKLGNGQ